jgi:hypothetical protein
MQQHIVVEADKTWPAVAAVGSVQTDKAVPGFLLDRACEGPIADGPAGKLTADVAGCVHTMCEDSIEFKEQTNKNTEARFRRANRRLYSFLAFRGGSTHPPDLQGLAGSWIPLDLAACVTSTVLWFEFCRQKTHFMPGKRADIENPGIQFLNT